MGTHTPKCGIGLRRWENQRRLSTYVTATVPTLITPAPQDLLLRASGLIAYRYVTPCAVDSAFADIVRAYKFHSLTYLLI